MNETELWHVHHLPEFWRSLPKSTCLFNLDCKEPSWQLPSLHSCWQVEEDGAGDKGRRVNIPILWKQRLTSRFHLAPVRDYCDAHNDCPQALVYHCCHAAAMHLGEYFNAKPHFKKTCSFPSLSAVLGKNFSYSLNAQNALLFLATSKHIHVWKIIGSPAVTYG